MSLEKNDVNFFFHINQLGQMKSSEICQKIILTCPNQF